MDGIEWHEQSPDRSGSPGLTCDISGDVVCASVAADTTKILHDSVVPVVNDF